MIISPFPTGTKVYGKVIFKTPDGADIAVDFTDECMPAFLLREVLPRDPHRYADEEYAPPGGCAICGDHPPDDPAYHYVLSPDGFVTLRCEECRSRWSPTLGGQCMHCGNRTYEVGEPL